MFFEIIEKKCLFYKLYKKVLFFFKLEEICFA